MCEEVPSAGTPHVAKKIGPFLQCTRNLARRVRSQFGCCPIDYGHDGVVQLGEFRIKLGISLAPACLRGDQRLGVAVHCKMARTVETGKEAGGKRQQYDQSRIPGTEDDNALKNW